MTEVTMENRQQTVSGTMKTQPSWTLSNSRPEHHAYRYFYFCCLSNYLASKKRLIDLLLAMDAFRTDELEPLKLAAARRTLIHIAALLAHPWTPRTPGEIDRLVSSCRPGPKQCIKLVADFREASVALAAGRARDQALAACSIHIFRIIRNMDTAMENWRKGELQRWAKGKCGAGPISKTA